MLNIPRGFKTNDRLPNSLCLYIGHGLSHITPHQAEIEERDMTLQKDTALATAQGSHRDDIQGLRALAVLAVVVFHVDKTLLPGGFIGVDVFFVISGYLISAIVLKQRDAGMFSFLGFYLARLRRIVPAYLVMLSLTSLFMAVLLIPADFDRFTDSVRAALYFGSNRYFAAQNDYFSPASHELPLLHTWSLAVEMQFYILLPILLVVTNRRLLPFLLFGIAAGLVAFSTYQLAIDQRQSVYFSLLARVPEFLVGSLLAFKPNLAMPRGPGTIVACVGLALVLGSFVFISADDPFPGILALPACIGTFFLIAASGSWPNAAFSNPIFVRIGDLSYSIYLWHWPLLAGFRYFYEEYHLPGAAAATVILTTLILSYLSWRFVEAPFRKIPLGKAAAVCLVMCLATLTASEVEKAFVEPLPDHLGRYAQADQICHGKILQDCSRGATAAETTVLLIGDSHAAQLNIFADVVGKALDIRFDVLTASSCVPIRGFEVDSIAEFARAPCTSQIAQIAPMADKARAVVIAGKWSMQMENTAFSDAMTRFLGRMRDRETPVLILGQIPKLEGDVRRALRFANLGLPVSPSLDDEWFEANEKVSRLVGAFPSADFLDLTDMQLFANAPFFQGTMIYLDSHHLNELGSRLYGEAAVPAFQEWLNDKDLVP